MSKILVLYYSSYGHIEKMARAAAEGAREAGAEVSVKRVPELVPEDVAKKSGFKLDQAAPVATVDELADYDAIIFGVPLAVPSASGAPGPSVPSPDGPAGVGRSRLGAPLTNHGVEPGGRGPADPAGMPVGPAQPARNQSQRRSRFPAKNCHRSRQKAPAAARATRCRCARGRRR